MIASPPAEVADALDLEIGELLEGGSDNFYWRADREGELVVLRRVADDRTGIEYEAAVLAFLHDRGWPVPVVLAGPVEIAGAAWTLQRWLPGRPGSERDKASQREHGRLLARLHDDLDALVGMGQRPGHVAAHEVLDDPALDPALASLSRVAPAEAHVMQWHADRAREMLSRLPHDEARRTVLHSDLTPWNVLYDGDELSGIVDFDFTHLDVAVADFALSWRGKYEGVIAGYHEVRPLTELDRALITPTFWAWVLYGVAEGAPKIAAGEEPVSRLDWGLSKLILRSPSMASAPAYVAP